MQIVNSYYLEEYDAVNKYTNHSGSYGIPTRKNAKAFYNGEVAYDLNGFYLYKRYNDGVSTSAAITELTLIFLGANSSAAHLTNASTAALDTQYSVFAL